ncbi:MAG: glucosyl transferase family 2 [Methylibium sp. NZG]|nr:MAG: glucosyl transferase family 2 [Methylibium sp. NZG]
MVRLFAGGHASTPASLPQREPRHEPTAPPIRRGSMVPVPWLGFWGGLKSAWAARTARAAGDAPAGGAAPTAGPAPWERAAARRRRALLWLIGGSAVLAAVLMARTQPMVDHPVVRVAQVLLFTLLFAWVSAGFFTALMGFWVQLRGDRHALSLAVARHQPLGPEARTAVIMPICNEQVDTVFAGLRATYESVANTGASRLFDFYVLSDTSDPAVRAAERVAWSQLRDSLGDGARVFYRWRQRRTRRKAGNVADFCRRWGRNYRYMVVLDADSVMTGDCIVTLAKLMEANPRAGIIQTAPQACGLDTVHARAQQFAGRTTGRLFTTGMQYWQLGESHYWGHNAIIRIEPFMKHCALAPLAGTGGLSGDILSHDFVEAALMRRAGYHTWLVPELAGSYEQQPPNLLEELKRDRRWCQGNLQNARLIAEPGLHRVHRAMLATGAMAYASAPLWLASVLLGAGVWMWSGRSVAELPATVDVELAALWVATLTMLLLPRALGVLSLLLRGEHVGYGGRLALVKGAVLEAMLSTLLAPVRMVAHSLFVIVALTGLKLDWKSPPREAEAVRWREAASGFGAVAGAVLALVAVTLVVAPIAVLWLIPLALPLLLAIPLTVLNSRVGFGRGVRARGLLVTPEEVSTPAVLRRAWALLGDSEAARAQATQPVAQRSIPWGGELLVAH